MHDRAFASVPSVSLPRSPAIRSDARWRKVFLGCTPQPTHGAPIPDSEGEGAGRVPFDARCMRRVMMVMVMVMLMICAQCLERWAPFGRLLLWSIIVFLAANQRAEAMPIFVLCIKRASVSGHGGGLDNARLARGVAPLGSRVLRPARAVCLPVEPETDGERARGDHSIMDSMGGGALTPRRQFLSSGGLCHGRGAHGDEN